VRDIESIEAATGGSYRITQITNSSSKVVVFEPILGTSQTDPQDNWYGGRNGSGGGVAGFQDGHAEVIRPGSDGYY
jgi:hypothetical protein